MKNHRIPPLISRAREYGSILGLETIAALLLELDNPQDHLKIIHIAGTNGKGSIASFCQGMLLENECNVGLFTSPYFEDPREMIRYNGGLISEKAFEDVLDVVATAVEKMLRKGKSHPTEFEVYVAAAFYYFSQVPLDFLLLEVGLGGREDATNVIKKPVLSIISQIGLDHTRFLGNSLQEIAYHKGGIIKERTPVIVYPQEREAHRVLQDIAGTLNSPLYSFDQNLPVIKSSSLIEQSFSVNFSDSVDITASEPPLTADAITNAVYPNVNIRLSGRHQVLNAATALLAVTVLREKEGLSIATEKILQGLYRTTWPGRLEIVGNHPLTIIDGAHNVPAAKSLKETLISHCSDYSITLILGMLEDKDVAGFLTEIIPLVDRVIVTKPLNPRALEPEELAQKLRDYPALTIIEPSISNAGLKALKVTPPTGLILAVGSLYMIGEAREFFLSHFNSSV